MPAQRTDGLAPTSLLHEPAPPVFDIPTHVPPELVRDVDIFDLPGAHEDVHLAWNVALSPRAVRLYAEEARALAIELIEALQPRGGCEFMADFARHLPMTIFLRLVDLPGEDRERLIALAEMMVRGGTQELKFQGLTATFDYLQGWIERRRAAPGDDLLSRIVRMQVDGRAATQDEVLGECAQVLFGGLDTVAGTMGFFARFLATHDAHRAELVADPSLIPAAIEELLRRHAIPIIGRRLTRDLDVRGATLRAGDKIMLHCALHGLDERAWPAPLEVDFRRDTTQHHAFGAGIHKCPGANLARVELQVFLEEWLKRIPEFRIAAGEHAETLPGQVMGVARLPLSWAV